MKQSIARRCAWLWVGLVLILSLAGVADDVVIGQQITEDYVVVYLAKTGWQFRLQYVGGLTDVANFKDSGLLVMNCLYFKTKTGIPQGIIRSQGQTLVDDDRRFGTAFVWDDKGWRLQSPGTMEFARNGFLTGPMLVRNSIPMVNSEAEGINPNRLPRPRSAIGRTADGSTVIVMTKKAYTLQEFAEFLTQFNLWEAINVDGGSSSFLYMAGESVVTTERQNIAALVVEPVPASAARTPFVAPALLPDAGMAWVTLDPGEFTGRVIFLNEDEAVEDLVDQWTVKPTVLIAPPLFDAQTNRTIGTLTSSGQLLQEHYGPEVGYAWGLTPRGFHMRRCQGTALTDIDLGACGPAYLVNGKPDPDLTAQGYTKNGGMFTSTLRTAIGVNEDGRLLLAASTRNMDPAQFSAGLQTIGARSAVGLIGGQRALLYVNGTWYVKPRGAIPYVIGFWRR